MSNLVKSFIYAQRIDNIRLTKGQIIIGAGIIFLGAVIAILLLNQGCAGLQINVPPFNGKFEHCARAAAAGEGAKSALLNQGLSENVASATGKTVEEAVIDALHRGETPEKVAEAAAAAVAKVVREVYGTIPGGRVQQTPEGEGTTPEQRTDSDAASAVFAAAGAAAAAAAASNSVESAAPAAKAAAEAAAGAAVRGEDEQVAKQTVLQAGLPENVGTAVEIGVKAQQAVQGVGTTPEQGTTPGGRVQQPPEGAQSEQGAVGNTSSR